MIIAIEGIDGCGKTTVVEALAERLAKVQTQYEVARLAFPNRESPTGRVIDGYLRDPAPFKGMDAYVHQALQVVNRLEVLPELTHARRLNVLSRYMSSAFVYGQLEDLPMPWLERVTSALPTPDLNVLLAVPPEVAFERMKARGVTSDQYERRGVEWFVKAARLYDKLWAEGNIDPSQGTSWLRVNARYGAADAIVTTITRFFLANFTCGCGMIHNPAFTVCKPMEEEE